MMQHLSASFAYLSPIYDGSIFDQSGVSKEYLKFKLNKYISTYEEYSNIGLTIKELCLVRDKQLYIDIDISPNEINDLITELCIH